MYNVTHDGDDLGALEIEYKEVEARRRVRPGVTGDRIQSNGGEQQ